MDTTKSTAPRPGGRDELDDSWSDLPIVGVTPPKKKAPAPEDELNDSWFDRAGGVKRSDVIDH